MSSEPSRQLFLLGQQLHRLSDDVPLAERKQHVCGSAFNEKTWQEIDRPDLCKQIVGEAPPARVALVCDAGLGKTTNMEWLQAHLARRGGRQLPVLVRLYESADMEPLEEEFRSRSRTPLLNWLAERIFGTADGDAARHLAALKQRQAAGRLTLLIDGLDHVSSRSSFATHLATMLDTVQWRRCPVWISGRPTAIEGAWNKLFSRPLWQFLRVQPLAEPEIRFYMSRHAGGDWYDELPEARALLVVPRFMRLICGILRNAVAEAADASAAREAIRRLRLQTPSDVYHYAFFHLGDADDPDSQGLLAQGLRGDAERIGLAGVDPDETNREQRVQRMAALLGAIAFEMLDGKSADQQPQPNFGGVKLDPFQSRVAQRMQAAEQGTAKDFGRDFPLLRYMNIHALDFLLFRESDGRRLAFHDRTVQAFFAAYWACRHATEGELKETRRWVVDPLFENNWEYSEFWRFAAEMREEAMPDESGGGVDLCRWLALFRPLYDGSVIDAKDRPIRSTEFIYRSWTRMERCEAGQEMLAAYRAGNTSWKTKDRIVGFIPLVGDKLGELIMFTMGSPAGEEHRGPNEFEHKATLSPYSLHRFCVTNVEFELFDPRHKDRRWWAERHNDLADDGCPVVMVSWYDAWCFAQWLGEVEREGTRLRVALPTEAQWEFACRAGRRTPFSFDGGHNGQSCTVDRCNFDGRFPYPANAPTGENRHRPIPVNALGRNTWGFYQMHGNVWEWCVDWYGHDFYQTTRALERDPLNREAASARVVRGGCFDKGADMSRSACRGMVDPVERFVYYGFRLAAVPLVGVKQVQ